MSTKDDRIELLQGTLDLLILRTLQPGPAHGHSIAKAIERTSDDVLQVEQGSLYPALHRLIKRGWIVAEDGTSENNRRAKFYRLTPQGKKQLSVETTQVGQARRRDRQDSPFPREDVMSVPKAGSRRSRSELRDHIDAETAGQHRAWHVAARTRAAPRFGSSGTSPASRKTCAGCGSRAGSIGCGRTRATRPGTCAATPASRSRSSSRWRSGIGLTTAIYSVVNAVLLRPLAYQHPERMVWLTTQQKPRSTDRRDANANGGPEIMNSIDFATWHAQSDIARAHDCVRLFGRDAGGRRRGVSHSDRGGLRWILGGQRRPAAAGGVADVSASRTCWP